MLTRVCIILSCSFFYLSTSAMNQLTRTVFKKAVTKHTQLLPLQKLVPHQQLRYELGSRGPCEDFCDDSWRHNQKLINAQSVVRNLEQDIDNEKHRLENHCLNPDIMAITTGVGAIGAGLLNFHLQLPINNLPNGFLLAIAGGGLVGASGYALNYCVTLATKYKHVKTLTIQLSEAQKTVAELLRKNNEKNDYSEDD